MSKKCRGGGNIQVQGVKRQSKDALIYLSVTDPLESCVKIRADRYESLKSEVGDVASNFNQFDKPRDLLNCPEPLCNTSGTLYFNFLGKSTRDGEGNEVNSAAFTAIEYRSEVPLSEYYKGVVTSYFVFTGAGSYNIKTIVTDTGDSTNTVSFEDTVVVGAMEPLPKTVAIANSIDSADKPLIGSDNPFIIRFEVLPADIRSAANKVGISTISMVPDKSDFENNHTVIFTCVDEFGMPSEVDLTENSCFGQELDADSVEPELTITAQQVTSNYHVLNPLLHSTDRTVAPMVTSMQATVKPITIDGVNYHGVSLPKFASDECGYISAFVDGCDAEASSLTYSTIKNKDIPDVQNFKTVFDPATGFTYLIVNDVYNDQSITVTYPKMVDAQVYDATVNFKDGRQVRAVIPFEFKGGKKGVYIINNAIVTSFPIGWSSTDNTAQEFTLKLRKDRNGVFFSVVYFDDIDAA